MGARAIGFVVVGAIAGAVNVFVRILFSHVVRFELAVFFAFFVALTIAFILNRRNVFEATAGAPSTQYGKFALVNMVALFQVWVISVGLAKAVFPWMGVVWHAEVIAHVIGVLSPIFTSFLAYEYFVFPESSRKSASDELNTDG